jgi:integrase
MKVDPQRRTHRNGGLRASTRPGRFSAGLFAVLRTARAMVELMVLGGLRRCEVLGLRLPDLDVAERRVFIAEGKGGHQRVDTGDPSVAGSQGTARSQ